MLESFIKQSCARNPSAVTPLSVFSGAFRAWVAARGKNPPTRGEIVEQLQASGFAVVKAGQAHVLGLSFAKQSAAHANG